MKDPDSVSPCKGTQSYCIKASINKITTDQFHPFEKEVSQITECPITVTSDATQVRTEGKTSSFLDDAADLSSSHVDSEITTNSDKPFLLVERDADINFGTSRDTGFDLNAQVLSNSSDIDPNHLYKIPICAKSGYASECGSSADPLEKKDPMRLWIEIKQNGFLSPSYGGVPMPKKGGKKSKLNTVNRKTELAKREQQANKTMELVKREQVNRLMKLAAPSGLLNELNPGIINHVRNRKQVRSIIEALVKSDEPENVLIQSKQAKEMRTRTRELSDGKKEFHNLFDSGTKRLNCHRENELRNTLSPCQEEGIFPTAFKRLPSYKKSDRNNGKKAKHENGTNRLEISSSITMAMENTSTLSREESTNKASVSSLGVKAANVALKWMELIHKDISSRLSALQRSSKRVQEVIQTELPLLISKELSSNQDMHQARWMALFDQMDKDLSEEAKQLESWLNHVKELHLHCEKGLQRVGWYTGHDLQLSGMSESATGCQDTDGSHNILAAAASIYSTCNFISSQKVQCS